MFVRRRRCSHDRDLLHDDSEHHTSPDHEYDASGHGADDYPAADGDTDEHDHDHDNPPGRSRPSVGRAR